MITLRSLRYVTCTRLFDSLFETGFVFTTIGMFSAKFQTKGVFRIARLSLARVVSFFYNLINQITIMDPVESSFSIIFDFLIIFFMHVINVYVIATFGILITDYSVLYIFQKVWSDYVIRTIIITDTLEIYRTD